MGRRVGREVNCIHQCLPSIHRCIIHGISKYCLLHRDLVSIRSFWKVAPTGFSSWYCVICGLPRWRYDAKSGRMGRRHRSANALSPASDGASPYHDTPAIARCLSCRVARPSPDCAPTVGVVGLKSISGALQIGSASILFMFRTKIMLPGALSDVSSTKPDGSLMSIFRAGFHSENGFTRLHEIQLIAG